MTSVVDPLPDGDGRHPSVASDSATVAGWTFASRVTGLLRVVVAAAVLGPTFFGNIFQTTNSLPVIVYNFLAGSLITAIVVPPLVRRLDRDDRRSAADLASRFAGVLLAATGALGVFMLLASPLLVRLLTVGVSDAEARRVTWVFLLLMAPQALGYGLIGVCVAAQNARQRFRLASAAPIAENLGVIATLLVSAAVFGTGTSVEQSSDAQLLVLGLGSTLAVGLHVALQWWGAHRAGLTIRPRLGWRDPDLVEMVRITVPSMGSTGLVAARYLALAIVAGTVPGGWVAFQIGLYFYNLPIALGGRPVGIAVLPRLSRLHQAGRTRAFAETYRHGLALAGSVAIPAAAAYLLLGGPIAETVAFGEMSTSAGIQLLTYSLVGLAVGVFAESSFQVTSQAAYARRQAREVFVATAVRVAVSAVMIVNAVILTDGPALLIGLGLAVSAGDSLGLIGLHRRLVEPSGLRSTLAPWSGTLVATLLGLAPAWLILVVADPAGRASSLLVFGAAAALGGLVYIAVHRRVADSPFLELLGLTRWAAEPWHLPRRRRDPDRRRRAPTTGLYAAGVICVLGGGAAAGFAPVLTVVALGGVLLVATVVARPAWAAYIYLAAMPFLAGLGRGSIVPLLRPTEVLQLALTIGLGIVLYRRLLDGHEPVPRLTRLDSSLLALAVAASVLPLAWLLLRGRGPSVEDLMAVFPFWKYLGLYALFRAAVRTEEQVRRCLQIIIVTALAVATIAMLQSLGVPGVRELLALGWAPDGGLDFTSNGRASTTLGSPIATADFLAYALALALAVIVSVRRSGLMGPVAVVFLGGLLATGQFTAAAALVIVTATVLWVTRRTRALVRLAVPAIPIVLVVGGALLTRRLADTDQGTGLPVSWLARIDNLTEFVLPHLHGWQLLLGVRPDPIIAAPETWRDEIFIESGHLWLLWVGGVPLLAAFAFFVWTAIRSMIAVARTHHDVFGIAAIAATAALVTIAVLTTFDPHLTMRGGADLLFALLALALVPWRSGAYLPWKAPTPPISIEHPPHPAVVPA
jgi:putative peptidoglycan lipid II flippase